MYCSFDSAFSNAWTAGRSWESAQDNVKSETVNVPRIRVKADKISELPARLILAADRPSTSIPVITNFHETRCELKPAYLWAPRGKKWKSPAMITV